ncbi:MAG: PSD1 and planctomycete cytochrome C domain-containing protein [Chryseolinea sp.]
MKRILLIAAVVSVTITGHYGASLTHGEDYLTSTFPSNKRITVDSPSDSLLSIKNVQLSQAQLQELNVQVRTILAHHCYKCHGPTKVKGELRLDSREFIMKGGKNGVVVVAGNPADSEIIQRVSLPRNHKDAMPEKGEGLSGKEIEWLRFWIREGAPWPEGKEKSLYRVASLAPRTPEIPPSSGAHVSPIDRFVNVYFNDHKTAWPQTIDDRTFIRRVYLDITGLLPAADSVDDFVGNTHTDKRGLLVARLLNRNDDYAQHWLTFWNDALRNDYSGTGYITGGRSGITAWLYKSLKQNKPYNTFVRELISPSKESKGFIEGIKWRGTINSSQRTEMQAAQNVSQVLLGLNIKCASCHDSFISDWKLEEAYAFANIFSDTILEINRCDKPTGKFAGREILFKELGKINPQSVTEDRLKQLADFLVRPEDGRLYRTLVNRIWAQVMGRGIVEPVDVMDNVPWSQDLLDWLAADFVASGYNIKDLIYKILTSETYQLPSVTVQEAEMITAQDYVFGGMLRRRLTAEQFSDAVSLAIQPVYPDSLVVSKLLPEMLSVSMPFARASLVKNDPFLTALGRPNRETVSTSRTSQANLLQALELTNGTLFNQTVKRGALYFKQTHPDATVLVEQVYRNALGRLPNEDERKIADRTLGKSPSEDEIQDFLWAITLHPEFQLIY